MNKNNLSKQGFARCGMGEIRCLRSHVEGLVQKKRQTDAPKVQEAVFALIDESGLEPIDLGFRLLSGFVLHHALGTKKKLDVTSVIDVKSLEDASIEQLTELLNELGKAEKTRKFQLQKDYRKKVWKVLKDSGIDPKLIGLEVIDGRYKLRDKYKDPETGAVWAGRGKTPNWLKIREEGGHSRQEFRVV